MPPCGVELTLECRGDAANECRLFAELSQTSGALCLVQSGLIHLLRRTSLVTLDSSRTIRLA